MRILNNQTFKTEYARLFIIDPLTANIFLLMVELADKKGRIKLGPHPEGQIIALLLKRFEDPRGYQL